MMRTKKNTKTKTIISENYEETQKLKQINLKPCEGSFYAIVVSNMFIAAEQKMLISFTIKTSLHGQN